MASRLRLRRARLCRNTPAALALAGLFSAGCADPVSMRAPGFSFPTFEQVAGNAPADRDLPDDVKSDAPLPVRYLDLLSAQSPVRSQGDRGVCTIFTSTALLEHTLIAHGAPDVDLSEQFLQWTHKREGVTPNAREGSDLGEVMDTLAARGTVKEALWPFEPESWNTVGHPECLSSIASRPLGCATNGEPPQAARTGSRTKLPVGRYLRTSAIKDYLYTQQLPVAVGVDFIAEAWSYPPDVYTSRPGAWERGEVPYPSKKEIADSAARGRLGHAVLIVGWDDTHTAAVLSDDGRPLLDAKGQAILERGFYIVKNSWGTDSWGSSNPHRAGYGLISQRYVSEFGSAYVVGLPLGLPPAASGELHTGGSGGLPELGSMEDVIHVAASGPLARARIDIAVSHPRASDLLVELRHDNSTWTLWAGGTGTSIRGTYNLSGELARTDRGGDWTLRVTDSVAGVKGTLESWSLTFE